MCGDVPCGRTFRSRNTCCLVREKINHMEYIYIQYVFLFEYWSKVSHLFVIHSPQFCEQPLGNWYVPSGRLGCNALGGAKLHGMKYGKTRCKWIYFKGYTTNHRWEYEME
jgi:hypothetical protein